MPSYQDLPYRLCVGVALFNRAGRVFVGRRAERGAEGLDPRYVWQMPQGGIDEGEDPWPAALRELYEETNVRSIAPLAEIAGWLAYDLPPNVAARAWGGRYRGQKQKWYAALFTGDDAEIDIAHPAGGHAPEFVEWRWERLRDTPQLVVPFKRSVYERVAEEFSRLGPPDESVARSAQRG